VGIERAPELAEVIRNAIESRLAHVNVSLPARVESFDATTQKVNAKPLVMSFYVDEAGNRQPQALPVIAGVPVAFPQGGGYALTFPLAVGDIGTLVWSQLSLDRWLSGTGAEVDPEFDHLHGLSDGIFFPGLRPFGAPLAGVPSDHAVLGVPGGVAIHLYEDRVGIGGDADYLALAAKVDAELALIATGINTTHTYTVTGSVAASRAKGT
jgi:hypothetical protein